MEKYPPMFAYVRMDSLNAGKIFQRRPGSCRWNGGVTDEFRRRLRALRGLCQDIVELRRSHQQRRRNPLLRVTGQTQSNPVKPNPAKSNPSSRTLKLATRESTSNHDGSKHYLQP
jgi:hypothetical protein